MVYVCVCVYERVRLCVCERKIGLRCVRKSDNFSDNNRSALHFLILSSSDKHRGKPIYRLAQRSANCMATSLPTDFLLCVFYISIILFGGCFTGILSQ